LGLALSGLLVGFKRALSNKKNIDKKQKSKKAKKQKSKKAKKLEASLKQSFLYHLVKTSPNLYFTKKCYRKLYDH